jgi:hypothetical protein
VIKKVHTNMCPILDGDGVMGIFNSCTRPRVNRVSQNQLTGDVLNLAVYLLHCQHYFRHLTHAVHKRAAACVAASGGIFKNQL